MKKSPTSGSSLRTDRRGVVFLEFLIAFVPLWVFFLCLIQLAFASYADLIVKHSADSAARSAAVVLPDDPGEYGGEPERSLDRNRVTDSDVSSPGEVLVNFGRSRLNTIRLAAHVPLLPLAPASLVRAYKPSIGDALPTERGLISALLHQPLAVALTFPGAEAGFATEPEITVRVTYAYPCLIPVARQILCDSFRELEFQEELGEAFFPFAQRFVGGRFRLVRRESTLMIHDAPYAYEPRGRGRS